MPTTPRIPASTIESPTAIFRFFSWIGTLWQPPAVVSCEDEATDQVLAFNVTRNRMLATRVTWAGTSATRRRGLLGRDGLTRNEGMYIVPTQWIHMFGMRFPIDVAFLDADGRVLCVHHELRPNRLSKLVWRADGALELPAGTLRETGTKVGDIIEMR